MPKFYVQSGNLEMVLQAHDPRCAAIWAIHRTLSQSLPFLCEDPVDYLTADDTSRLGDIIRVNERGFDCADSVAFETLDAIAEWLVGELLVKPRR